MKPFDILSTVCYSLSFIVIVSACAVHLTCRLKGIPHKKKSEAGNVYVKLMCSIAAVWLCDYHIFVFGKIMSEWLCVSLFMAQSVLSVFLIQNVKAYACFVFSDMSEGDKMNKKSGANNEMKEHDFYCAEGGINMFIMTAATFTLIGETVFFAWPIIGRTGAIVKWIGIFSCVPATILIIWLLLRLIPHRREFFRSEAPKSSLCSKKARLGHAAFLACLPAFLCATTMLSLRKMLYGDLSFSFEGALRAPVWMVVAAMLFYIVWTDFENRESAVLRERTRVIKYRLKDDGIWLSEREADIASLICQGKSNKEIAGQLYLSPNTVKVHASNLYKKIGASNRAQAVGLLTSIEDELRGKSAI